MNRSDLVTKVFQNIDSLNKNDIELGINQILEVLSLSLEKKNRIEIRGFGTFSTRNKVARVGRNPKTGIEAEISERRVITFRASNNMKQSINRQPRL